MIRVRRARIEELEEVVRIHHESAEAAYANLAPPDLAGRDRRRRLWRQSFETPGCSQFVAEVSDEIVGVLALGPASDGDEAGEIYLLYVQPGSWGRGVGQSLLGCAHQQLGHDYEQAVLTVVAGNERARRFYERNGWSLEGLQTELHFGGHPIEVAKYRRLLSPS
jgi:RimJ/RimL family protein N-acetyltransferase